MKKKGRAKEASLHAKKRKSKGEKPVHGWLGGVFFVFSLWLLVSFFTLLSSGEENWLGSIFGGVLILSLLKFFGHVSILLFAFGLCLLAVFCFGKYERKIFARLSIGFFLLSLCASYFMAFRARDSLFENSETLAETGGLLGHALLKESSILLGNSFMLQVLLGILLLVSVLAVCFGLRANHLSFLPRVLKSVGLSLFSILKKIRMRPKFSPELTSSDLENSLKPVASKKASSLDWEDETVIEIQKKARPFRAGGAWAASLGTLTSTEPIFSDEEGIPEELPPKKKEDRLEELERYLRENSSIGDLEKRKIRDEIAELRRVRQMNRWEDENAEKPLVQGIVRVDEDEKTLESTESALEESSETEMEKEKTQEETIPKPISPLDDSENSPPINDTLHIEYDEYKIPAFENILNEVPEQLPDYTTEELQKIARELELSLESFKVKGKVTNIVTGPVITRFEVEPGPGIKVTKFINLQDDLAMSLSAKSIRILAPIPGKSVVGIEIPNRQTQTIYCREMFENFNSPPNKLEIVLGKDITGVPFSMDLTKAPHLLIAGQTGAGKSVGINVLIASLLLSKSPDEVRLVLVDPKVVELKMYENIPHLLSPVITQPEVAVQALHWMCIEMDRRYEVIAKAKVRNIEGFNEKIASGNIPEELPEEERKKMFFIVVIIDELSDLMMTAGKEVEHSIARIAQKARAVGIHLVLATQRPSAQVITGLIKANLPTRIAFKVGSGTDSRIILDNQGAERLLGRGDMLFRPGDSPEPIRIHGAFLKDEEAEKLALACASQNVNYLQVTSFETDSDEEKDELISSKEKLDPLLFDVALSALDMGGISISGVQRAFSVGFSRAGKIVDQMRRLGICGKAKGNSKPSEILMSEEEIRNLMERF